MLCLSQNRKRQRYRRRSLSMLGGSFRKSINPASTISEGKNEGHQQVVHRYTSSIRSSWRMCLSVDKIHSSTSAEDVGRIRASTVRSAQKCLRMSSGQLKSRHSTHMRARLKLHWHSDPAIMKWVKLTPQTYWEDHINTNGFLQRKVFSEEATFYVSGRVNGRNVKKRGYESLHALFVHPDPVCRRILPASMRVFCHSSINGLPGNVLWYSAQKLR